MYAALSERYVKLKGQVRMLWPTKSIPSFYTEVQWSQYQRGGDLLWMMRMWLSKKMGMQAAFEL